MENDGKKQNETMIGNIGDFPMFLYIYLMQALKGGCKNFKVFIYL